MSTITGPLNLNYASYMNTSINLPAVTSVSTTFTFNHVAAGQAKSPYFNILQAMLGPNDTTVPGQFIYIGVHEPGTVFDGTPYVEGSVDMAIWNTNVTPTAKNGSTVGYWNDAGVNVRFMNGNIHLVDGVSYTVSMSITGNTVTGYLTDAAGNKMEIGTFSGLDPLYSTFKNRIITELEFTSTADNTQEPSVSTSATNVAFNGSMANVDQYYNSQSAGAAAGTVAGNQLTKAFGDTYFETAAGYGSNAVTLGADNLTVLGNGTDSILRLSATHHNLTAATITGVTTLDLAHQSAVMKLAQFNDFTSFQNADAGVVFSEAGTINLKAGMASYTLAQGNNTVNLNHAAFTDGHITGTGKSSNTIVFDGAAANFTTVKVGHDYVVTDKTGVDGVVTLSNVQHVTFNDAVVSLDVNDLKIGQTSHAAGYNAIVEGLYVSYFGRPADATGYQNMANVFESVHAPTTLREFVTQYNTNDTIRGIIDGFSGSVEANHLYAGASTRDFVTSIYNNLLGRAPDASGLDFWANAIDSGTLTRGLASVNMLMGAQSSTEPQGLLDADLVNTRMVVAANFTSAIDTTAETNGYSGDPAAAAARSMLSHVDNATDVLAYQSTINTTLTDLVNAVTVVGVSPAVA